jgi:hypothetical protein
MVGQFKIGELVRHKQSEMLVFLVEAQLGSVDGADRASLYRCSETKLIGYERQIYREEDLVPAGDVTANEKAGALKLATTVLYEMLEMAKNGGMRGKRAAELYEEFVDHWNALDEEKDQGEPMEAMLGQIRQLVAVVQKEGG